MGEPGEKFHAQDCEYEPDEAEYDAADFQYHIVNLSGDIVCACPSKEERDRILITLNSFMKE